jgi:predicted Zn finger-like uncharacterized protein
MIIECQTCHARFRLDESRIKGRGARVKCRKCGDSIVVLKEGASAPPAPAGDGFFDLGSAVRDSAGETPASPPAPGNLIPFTTKPRPAEPAVSGIASPPLEETATGKDEVDLAFDRVLSAGPEESSPSIGEAEAAIPAPPETGMPVEGEAPSGPESRPELNLGELTLDFGPEEKLDLPSAEELERPFGEPPVVDTSAEFRGEGEFLISDSDTLDFLQEKHREAPPEAPPAIGDISLAISAAPAGATSAFLRDPDISPSPDALRDSPTAEEGSIEGNATPTATTPAIEVPPHREAETPPPERPLESPVHRGSAAPEPRRQRSSAWPAVAAVLAVLLAAGGYLGLTASGRKTLEGAIPGISALWGGGPAALAAPKYDLRNVIGYYESGGTSTRILVIKGQVANLSTVEKSGIRVHAVLLDNTDVVLAQQAVYAGNVLSGDAIRKGNRDALSKALENRFGEGLANMHIAPGKAIPFMVVFFDAPANMDSYKLEAKDGE